MLENSYENCSKMGKMVLEYAAILYFKKYPDNDERDFNEYMGKDGSQLILSLLTGSFLLYHQALRQTMAQKGIDIGDFPDPISIDFESLPLVPPSDH